MMISIVVSSTIGLLPCVPSVYNICGHLSYTTDSYYLWSSTPPSGCFTISEWVQHILVTRSLRNFSHWAIYYLCRFWGRADCVAVGWAASCGVIHQHLHRPTPWRDTVHTVWSSRPNTNYHIHRRRGTTPPSRYGCTATATDFVMPVQYWYWT